MALDLDVEGYSSIYDSFADPGDRAIKALSLRPFACWDYGFESRMDVMCWQVEFCASRWSLVQRSATYFVCVCVRACARASEYDREASEKSRGLIWQTKWEFWYLFNLWKPIGHVMHQQFNIQQLYALPTLYLCVLYLSENKQWLVPLTG